MLLAKDFKKRALSSLNGKWGSVYIKILICASIGLICQLISNLIYQIPPIDISNPWAIFDIIYDNLYRISQLIIFIGFLISSSLAITENWVYLQAANKKDTSWSGFIGTLKRLIESFILTIIMYIRIFLWTLLFIIPGIIKIFAYSMAVFIKIENPQMSSNEAINRSNQMMKGNKWRLFCLLFSFIGWWILLSFATYMLTLILGGVSAYIMPFIEIALTILVTIYSRCAVAHFYKSLKREGNDDDTAEM